MKTKTPARCPNTYAASVGATVTNWPKELAAKSITPERWSELKKLAKDWPTCACGNQCSIIPRDVDYHAPKDGELFDLGHEFFHEISEQSAMAALAVWHQIEARAAIVIRETLAAQKRAKKKGGAK